MGRTSAGLLPYRRGDDGRLEVFIAHMGGPLWARRDAGGWSIVKGEYDAASEAAAVAAAREFGEETGVPAPGDPATDWLDLGEVRTKSGKVIRAWAVHSPGLAFVASGTFTMEWPRGSGRVREFPEVDRAEWYDVATAATKLVGGQVPLLDRLSAALGDGGSGPATPR